MTEYKNHLDYCEELTNDFEEYTRWSCLNETFMRDNINLIKEYGTYMRCFSVCDEFLESYPETISMLGSHMLCSYRRHLIGYELMIKYIDDLGGIDNILKYPDIKLKNELIDKHNINTKVLKYGIFENPENIIENYPVDWKIVEFNGSWKQKTVDRVIYEPIRFSERFLRKFADKFTTFKYLIIDIEQVSNRFLKEFSNKICWDTITSMDIPEHRFLMLVDKIYISKTTPIYKKTPYSEKTIDKYIDKWDWKQAHNCESYFSKHYITKYLKYLNVQSIAGYNDYIDETFVEKHLDELDINELVESRHFDHLTEDFIIRHIDKFNIADFNNYKFSQDFVEKYGMDHLELFEYEKLSVEFLDKWSHKLNWENDFDTEIPLWFIEKHKENIIKYSWIPQFSNIKESFIIDNFDKIKKDMFEDFVTSVDLTKYNTDILLQWFYPCIDDHLCDRNRSINDEDPYFNYTMLFNKKLMEYPNYIHKKIMVILKQIRTTFQDHFIDDLSKIIANYLIIK